MLKTWPVAGLLAGILIFFWGGLTHMAFNIDNYFKTFASEDAIFAALQANAKEPGVYFYPNEMDPAKMSERAKTAPRGLITYTPAGTPFSMGQSLGVQCGIDILCGLFLAFLYSIVAGGLQTTAQRVGFPALVGVFGVLSIQVPFWNWYGFPAGTLVSGVVEQGVAGLIAGFVFSKLLK